MVSQTQVDPQMDSILEAKEVQIERKRFHFEFRENERGKFLRITEEAHGRRNTIIVPSTGLHDFTSAIGDVLGTGGRDPGA
jgi:PurA-like ssDNA and RNA-binding protein